LVQWYIPQYNNPLLCHTVPSSSTEFTKLHTEPVHR